MVGPRVPRFLDDKSPGVRLSVRVVQSHGHAHKAGVAM